MADNYDVDEEVRQSLTEIEKQRSRKLWGVIIGVVVVALVIGLVVLLSYSEEPDAAKEVPGAAAQ